MVDKRPKLRYVVKRGAVIDNGYEMSLNDITEDLNKLDHLEKDIEIRRKGNAAMILRYKTRMEGSEEDSPELEIHTLIVLDLIELLEESKREEPL